MRVVAVVADRLRAAADVDDIGAILHAACVELGFPFHALVHHCDIAHPPAHFLFLQNYPADWVEAYARLGLHRHDPAHRVADLRPGGFAWSDISSFSKLSPRELGVLDDCHSFGLGEGFTVPLHAHGLRGASCSFATAPGEALPRETLFAAELVARLTFSAIFDRFYLPASRMPPILTPREIECVSLISQGKSDWEIAVILGIKEQTVTEYLNNARRRFGVNKRGQLIVAAIAHGLLGWDEIVTWQPLP